MYFACSEGTLGEIVQRKQGEKGCVRELGDKDGGLGVPSRIVLKGKCEVFGESVSARGVCVSVCMYVVEIG